MAALKGRPTYSRAALREEPVYVRIAVLVNATGRLNEPSASGENGCTAITPGMGSGP